MSAALSLSSHEREDGKVGLRVLSQSEVTCFRRCVREWYFRYIALRRPRRSSEALRFGTFFHIGLNAWWATPGEQTFKLAAALLAIQERAASRPEDADPFELVKAEELLLGYTARWGDEDYETLGVEVPFEMPMVNPVSGAESRTFKLQGKIDAIARHDKRRLRIIEHKTTSKDITFGSNYWRLVSATDPQVSTYLVGARAAGYEAEDCIYDVVRKVALRPGVATPEEKRSYTKEKSKQCPLCKKGGAGPHVVDEITCADGRLITDPGGRLHANQRETDETAEEFRARVREDIQEKPEKYFARGEIVRLARDEAEYAGDVWQSAWFMREARNAGRYPRSPNACERYGRLCDFFGVCSGETSIENESLFRSAETPHEELVEV